ncbi:hypothetical protein [Apilactobacillus micheneri]|uniref:hypothetical protein n=1 Tax=Apilactobacillus micheneri TaxID=1899430 RepID=UPI000D523DD2|nr:hypothetical protein [Apilactobacillus micheneri]GAY79915.1 hypothetical protein NBRC113063_00779 [Apilactobacillus micheneri]
MIKNKKNRLDLLHLVADKFKLPTGIYKQDMRNVFNYIIVSTDRLDKLKRSAN